MDDGIIVTKFGGSTLASADDYRRAASIISSQPLRVIAVVSAQSGVTDSLVCAIEECAKDEEAASRHAQLFLQAHAAIADIPLVREIASRLERALASAYYASDSARLSDFILSFGERASAALLGHFLFLSGVQNVVLDSEAAGIASNGVFRNASCDLAATRTNLRRALELHEGKHIVITGFYGIDTQGNVNLFGRGGTDYTAGAVAAAVGAHRLILYKDVAGFLRADPKVVPNSTAVGRVSFDEAAELGYFGAKIIHPRTFDPLAGTGIEVEIRPAARPAELGTVIAERSASDHVVAIASKKSVAVVEVYGGGMVNAQGVAAEIFSAMAAGGIGVDVIATSQANISFTIDARDAPRAQHALAALSKARPDVVESFRVTGDRSLVAVVGSGAITPSVMCQALSCLSKAGVSLGMGSFGASRISFSAVVPGAQEAVALRALYDEFFAQKAVVTNRTV